MKVANRTGAAIAVAAALLASTYALTTSTAHSSPSEDGGDEGYFRVAERVPEFGGAYFEGSQLQIWLTKPSEKLARQARAALVELVGEDFNVDDINVRSADYSYLDLTRWNSLLIDIHEVARELVSIGVSQRTNQILIGVANLEESRPAIEAELRRLEVPQGAVNLEESEPIVQLDEPSSPTLWAVLIIAIGILIVGVLAITLHRVRRGRLR